MYSVPSKLQGMTLLKLILDILCIMVEEIQQTGHNVEYLLLFDWQHISEFGNK